MRTPLDTLTELAREARDQAMQHLASARRDERQVADQLSSLEHYRQEYAERLHQNMRSGIDPATLHNTQRFLAVAGRRPSHRATGAPATAPEGQRQSARMATRTAAPQRL